MGRHLTRNAASYVSTRRKGTATAMILHESFEGHDPTPMRELYRLNGGEVVTVRLGARAFQKTKIHHDFPYDCRR